MNKTITMDSTPDVNGKWIIRWADDKKSEPIAICNNKTLAELIVNLINLYCEK